MKEIHYFYKITNLINGKFYYGIRTCRCLPGQDPYMGSGKYLHRAFRKYGIENFRKEILRVCRTREDALDLEAWIVNMDLVKNPNCYNIVRGGQSQNWKDMVPVKIKESGEFTLIPKEEYYNNKSLYETSFEGKIAVKLKGDTNSKYSVIPIEKYRLNKSIYELPKKNYVKGLILCKDNNGNNYKVDKDDPRYLSGDLVPVWLGRHHSKKSKDIISEKNSKANLGEKNPRYGKTLVNNGRINKAIPLSEVDEFLKNNENWRLGKITFKGGRHSVSLAIPYRFPLLDELSDLVSKLQKVKLFHYTNGYKNIMIDSSQVHEYELNGFRRGITKWSSYKSPGKTGLKLINNGIEQKFVKIEEVDRYLENGWNLGYIKKRS